MKLLLSAVAIIFLASCTKDQVQTYVTPENVRVATALVCSNALQFVKTDAERVKTANYIYAVAHAVRTLSGGKVPTVADMKSAIGTFTPDDGKYATLAVNISSIWGAIYPSMHGDAQLALAYLEAVATGCEAAAQPYLPKTTAMTPIELYLACSASPDCKQSLTQLL